MNKKLLTLLKISFSLGLFYIILESLDFSGTIDILRNTKLSFFLFALFILVIQITIANNRWQIVLKNFDFNLTYVETLRYLWVGLFFNQALPTSIGGDAVRGYYLHKTGNNIKNSTLGVLIDRLFGFIGLFVLALLVAPFLFNRFNSVALVLEILLVYVGMLCIIVLVLVIDLFPYKLPNWKITRGLYSLSFEFRKIILNKVSGIFLLLLSISIHLCSILAVLILSEGLALNIEWIGIILVIPLVTIFTLIPISLAGWGVREGVMILGLGYINVPPEEALALSILYGLLMLVISLPGGLIWLIKTQSLQLKN